MAADLTALRERCAQMAVLLKTRMEAFGWTQVRYWQDRGAVEAGKHATWHADGILPTGEHLSTATDGGAAEGASWGPDGALYRLYGAALEVAERGVG